MVEGGGGTTTFPVIFFDGERELDIGDIRVHPKLTYKAFQCMLAQEIGISPNQISIYLIDHKNSKSPGTRRKIPITGKANFAQICRERNCCFLVVLKRSRKSRNRNMFRNMNSEFENDFSPPRMPENVILLRRDQPLPVEVNFNFPFYDHFLAQQYMNPYGLVFPKIEEVFPKVEEAYPKMVMNKYFCEECIIAKKKGGGAEFHHCVNDVVLEGFRISAAGPIGPIRW